MSLLGAFTHTQKCSIRDMEKISNKFHQEAPTTTIFLLQIVQQTVGNEEYFFSVTVGSQRSVMMMAAFFEAG